MLSESQKGGIRPKIYMAEFHCPYSRLKGHSCENCLSNCVLDLDLNMQTHFSSTLANVWEGEPIIAVATKMLAWRYAMNSYSQFEMGFKLKWNSKNSIPHFPSQHLFEANLFEWKSSGTETHPEHVQWKRCGKYTRVSYFSQVKEVMASWRWCFFGRKQQVLQCTSANGRGKVFRNIQPNQYKEKQQMGLRC